MPRLDPDGNPVDLGDQVTLITPGLDGDAEHFTGGLQGTRSLALSTPLLDAAFAEHDYRTQRTIEIADASETPGAPAVPVRSTAYGEAAMILTVPKPNADFIQVVYMQDEAGLVTWNFAQPQPAAETTERSIGTQTFVLRRYVPPQRLAGQARGPIGAIGTKIIKVLAFPIQQIAGSIATSLAREWEAQKRPYALRMVAPTGYGSDGAGAEMTPQAWSGLSGRRTLLLVHGTFARSWSTFGQIPMDVFTTLYDAYQGRVVAFDHPTMTATPRENVEWFLDRIPDGTHLEFDALTHSRGGLVARTLAERQGDLTTKRDVHVRNLVLTAVPDSGTTLSDAQYMGDFIDAYTNLLSFFPDVVMIDVLHCVLEAVKEIAAGALDHLTGLQSMMPAGPFQSWLNAGPKGTGRYFAVASDYSPTDPGLVDWAKRRLFATIFKQANDIVVPTAGVYDTNGSDCFPIDSGDRLLFGEGEGVWHCNYFAQPKLHAKLTSWLS